MTRFLALLLLAPLPALGYNESAADRAYRYYLEAAPMRTDPTQGIVAGALFLAAVLAGVWIFKRYRDRQIRLGRQLDPSGIPAPRDTLGA